MKVKYLEHAGSDNTIANTARVSMEHDVNWQELPEGYTEEQRDRLIAYLAKHQHTSPFRHTSISIAMQVPLYIARQLMKHQAGLSWNEISRRYVSDGFEFEEDVVWRSAPTEGVKQGSSDPVDADTQAIVHDTYQKVLNMAEGAYDALLSYGVAPEQARMILPQSMMVDVVWTGNLLAFAHVYNLRIKSNAQKEVRDFAELLDDVIDPLYPVAWKQLTHA